MALNCGSNAHAWIRRHIKASGTSQNEADEKVATQIDLEGYALAAL